jgi:hypothetical protein
MTEIVCTPEPGMLKEMLSGPGVVLAASMALRSDPRPVSDAVVTGKFAATSGATDVNKTTIQAQRRRTGEQHRYIMRSSISGIICH